MYISIYQYVYIYIYNIYIYQYINIYLYIYISIRIIFLYAPVLVTCNFEQLHKLFTQGHFGNCQTLFIHHVFVSEIANDHP